MRHREFKTIPYVLRLFVLTLLLLTGCSQAGGGLESVAERIGIVHRDETGAADEAETYLPMESEPVLDYEVLANAPGIIVDRGGYSSSAQKTAYLTSAEKPGNFRVVNAATGKPAFGGTAAEVTYDEVSGLYVGRADFSEVTGNGRYYLEEDTLGRSYTFCIEDSYFGNVLADETSKQSEQVRTNEAQAAQVLILLQAYEWFPELLADVPESVRAWIAQIDYSTISEENLPTYVCVLSKFGFLYRQTDMTLATECVQKASNLYSQMGANSDQSGIRFRALTELYKASGSEAYGSEIIGYEDYLTENPDWVMDSDYLYAAMNYMVTRRTVDSSLCKLLMNRLLEAGEDVGGNYRELVGARDCSEAENAIIRRDIHLLMCANYVLGSYHYDRIIQILQHHTDGCNAGSVIYSGSCVNNPDILAVAWLANLEQNNKLLIETNGEW